MNTEQKNGIKHHLPIVYKIYGELKKHIGRDNAIKAEDLADKFNIDKRTLRFYISEIRKSTELEKVVTSTNDGYFICTTKKEFEQTNKRLLSMAFSLLKAARSNERKAGLDGQTKIALGEYFSQCFEAFGNEEQANRKFYFSLSSEEINQLPKKARTAIKEEANIAGSVMVKSDDGNEVYILALSDTVRRFLSLDKTITASGATLEEAKAKFIAALNAAL